jgi:outer membrane protein assembly factor BamB
VIRRFVHLAALSLGLAALCSQPASGQSDPFAGWEQMFDDDYRFDPDERSLLGFSVSAPIDVRTAYEAVERAFAVGDAETAANRLLENVRSHSSHVLQVAEGSDRWNSRWVGAAEWALYQQLTRVPDSVRASVLSLDEHSRLAMAARWRDVSTLADLAHRNAGLPAALTALRLLARLQIEQGRTDAARATLARLDRMGAGEIAQTLGAALPARAERQHEPLLLPHDTPVFSTWPHDVMHEDSYDTVLATLTDRDSHRHNPFTQSVGTYEAPFSPIVPVIADGVVYVADTISIWAQDLLSGRRLWHHRGPLEVVDEEYPFSDSFHIGVYANLDRRRAINPHQLAQPLVVGDRVVATVQVTEEIHHLDTFENVPINHPLPRRRLRVLDRVTGELLWSQERPEQHEKAFVNRFDVDGPAVSEGQVVYVAGSVTEGAINAYLAAFDLITGDLIWRASLCAGQQELTMFNRPFQEHLISPPLLHEGSLYVCTNLGVIGCVDAWSGRVRWLAAYESIVRKSSRMVRPQNARPVHWLNQPPIVVDDTLVVAPLDSAWLQGLDRRTGRRQFELGTRMSASMRPPLRHQAIAVGSGRFAVVNDESVECFEASTGGLAWMSKPFGPYQELTGAAVVDGDRLLVPAETLLVSLDLQTGQQIDSVNLPSTSGGRRIQRLAPEGPVLVMTDGESVFASVDHDIVRRRAVGALGHDPRAALALGELALAEQDQAAAAAFFERVLASDPTRELLARARSGRMEASRRAAEQYDTPSTWSRVLEVADTSAERFIHAEVVLQALQRLGAERHLVDWLAVLALDEPQRLLVLGADGPLPIRLHYSLKRLQFESPRDQVALLQQLVESRPEALWDGLAIAEEARRRISELLVRHGRNLYESFEAEAKELLAGGASLETIEERYPNARVVATQRLILMEQLLASGEERRVFEEARDAGVPELLALRARAARAMGERAYAEAIEGQHTDPPAELPALPRDSEGRQRVVLSEDHSVTLYNTTGRAAPELAGAVVASIEGSGAYLLLDTRTGQVRWDGKPLPAGVREGSSSLSFHMHDELLLVRGRNTLQAVWLLDGQLLWERTLPGRVHNVVPMSGLLVTLSDYNDSYRIEGYGMATGARAFRIDLPEAEDVRLAQAGDQLVCLTTGGYEKSGRGRDKRLLVLDLVRGAVVSSMSLGDGFKIANTVSDPPVVLLSERVGIGSRLVAFSPLTAEILWEHSIESSNATSNRLFPTATDRLVLRTPASAPNRESRKQDRDRIISIHALTGPEPSATEIPLLRVVDPSPDLAPRVVLVDPDEPNRLVVLDGRDPGTHYSIDLGYALPRSSTFLHHASDGFVLLSSPYDTTVTTVWVIRGEHGKERYSVRIEEASNRGRYQVVLVDGAIVLANGGVVQILRSTTP